MMSAGAQLVFSISFSLMSQPGKVLTADSDSCLGQYGLFVTVLTGEKIVSRDSNDGPGDFSSRSSY